MKILLVNKFLHPAGGAETYVFQLGAWLEKQGHEVQYFGMEHPNRCVGNRINAYTSNMDFHNGNLLKQLSYPLKIICSKEARRKMTAVLEDFRPDVVHINNFNYQLTPSILQAAEGYKVRHGVPLRIIYTAHDYQLICPNHLMYRPLTGDICERCLDGKYRNCISGRCIHGSALRSVLGALESWYWHRKHIYDSLDAVICPSAFLKEKIDVDPMLAGKTVVLRNFVSETTTEKMPQKDYVLYFGRFFEEKGLTGLIQVCKRLPEISFVFAGSGPMESQMEGIPNLKNVGFQSGAALKQLICQAKFTVYPSIWYENCPFSVIESLMCGTPVLGAAIGGITELIQHNQTGRLFQAGNLEALQREIETMWRDDALLARLRQGCQQIHFDTLAEYTEKLFSLYCPPNSPKKAGIDGAN